MKLKDRNRKQKEREEEKNTPLKHRKTLNIKFDFKEGNPQLNKSEELNRKSKKTEDPRRGFIIRTI